MAAPNNFAAVFLISAAILFMLVPYQSFAQNNKKSRSLIIKVDDVKEFKKLLRTRTNLLVVCAQSEKATAKLNRVFEEVAEEMKGKATLAYINCGEDKKFCKKIKVQLKDSDLELKHYKDGEFNKNYDRKLAVKSMVNFLMDPTGDIPWEEDPTATSVVHISTEEGFTKLIKKDKNPLLVMFYAPWCGYCKRMKPDFAAVAAEVKNQYTLVGVDVDKSPTMALRVQYNITGFPTLLLFEKGKVKYKYGSDNDKASMLNWLKNPSAPPEVEKEPEWADEAGDVVHLTDDTMEGFLQENPSVLVMFYAPWCGHCKKMKPAYSEAATLLKSEGIQGVIAAVDATKERKLAQDNSIKGFPTVKYYKNGEFAFEVNERDKDGIVKFMKDPQEPPPPPPPEKKWEEIESEVVHLSDETFKGFLKKKKHCLVMFYAPWCGHCKKAKPEYMEAASKLKDDTKVALAAVDCTVQTGTCSSHDVTGYPTFKYFNYGRNPQKYMGGREMADFVAFLRDPLNPTPAASSNKPPAEPVENQWRDLPGADSLAILNTAGFDEVIKSNVQTLVMFYAPWCGHCKKMKPDFALAAQAVQKYGVGTLAAVDATQDPELASKYGVSGYPTLKYFADGQVKDYSSGRAQKDLVGFMLESLLGDEGKEMAQKLNKGTEGIPYLQSKAIKQLAEKNFPSFIKDKDAALVFFYKPDCQNCNAAKPHFLKAAKGLNLVANKKGGKGFAIVDCSTETELCEREKISEYPAFRLYVGGRIMEDVNGSPHYTKLSQLMQGAPTAPSKSKEEL